MDVAMLKTLDRCRTDSPNTAGLNPERSGKETEWQSDGEEDHFENSVDSDSDDTEGQKDQPYKWIGDERQKSKRPAENEQNAPEQEGEHG